jgi:hypothetical protein
VKPQPSEELLEKVRSIAYRKSMVSLAYRGEFNKFGVYVQSKDIHEQDVTKTIYMAGGRFIPKLIFMEVNKDLPLEIPGEVFEDLDFDDPAYDNKYKQRYDRYLEEGGFFKPKVIINKYEPGDWENKLDLLYTFTLELEEKYKGQDYP